MSRYLILEASLGDNEATGAWHERGTVEATNRERAFRAYMTQHGSEIGGGVYMAVPERSSKRIHVEVQNVRKVSVKAGEDG